MNSVRNGYIKAYNCAKRPKVWNLSFSQNVPASTMAVVPVKSSTGEVCIYSSAETDVLLDVMGWFAPTDFGIMKPQRLIDTRTTQPQGVVSVSKAMIGQKKKLKIKLTKLSALGLPATGVAGVLVTVTVKSPAADGALMIYPCGVHPKLADLNYFAGQKIGTTVVVPVQQTTGRICVYSSAMSDVVVDIAGWIANDKGFTSLSPVRISDTSKGIGAVPGR